MRKRCLLALLLFAACSEKPAATTTTTSEAATGTAPAASPAPPTPAEAQKIIAASEQFRELRSEQAGFNVPLTLDTATDETKSVAEDLARTGWVTIDGASVTLTDKAKRDERFQVRQNGSFDILPLGTKEILAIKQILPGDQGQVRVFLDWKWAPNEISSEIDLLAQMFIDEDEALATLIHDGTSWSVLKITPA